VDPAADDRPSYLDYSDAELLELTQGNLQAVVAATVGHLRATGAATDAWVAALGDAFSRGWDEPEPWTPGEFLDAIAVNLRALGAEIVEIDATGEPATLRTRGFPDRELCERLGVDVADVLRYNDSLDRVARERGVRWGWRRDGDDTVYSAATIEGAS
jgi:hypothetical protein